MKTIKHVILVSAFIAVCGCADKQRTGILEVVGPARVDFGDYPAWEQRVAEYRIRNAGNGPLAIVRIRETCQGCAHASSTRQQLAPGDDALIRIAVLPNSLSGRFEKAAYIETTNSSARFVQLQFAGNAVPLVKVKPSNYIYMGRIGTNQKWHQSFQLTATTNGIELGQPIMQTSNLVEIAFAASSNAEDRSSGLIVTVLSAPEPGDFNCAIKVPILSPTGYPPVEISIEGKIGSELVALPGLLCMPGLDAAAEEQFRLKILGDDRRRIDFCALQMPECEGVELSASPTAGTDGDVAVTVRFNSAFIRRLHSEKRIVLKIGLPGVAPARVVCEEVESE